MRYSNLANDADALADEPLHIIVRRRLAACSSSSLPPRALPPSVALAGEDTLVRASQIGKVNLH